jgi:putative transposase
MISLMRKTYKYRIYPSKKQLIKLKSTLDSCRFVYNKTLELRKITYEAERKTLTNYDTNAFLTQWKSEFPFLKNTHSQLLQNAQQRVDLAFKAFFRRLKTAEKPGFPRFKSWKRYDSFTFPQSGFKLCEDGLYLSKIGIVNIKLHRELQGKVKTLTIRRTSTNKWYACFSVELPDIDNHPISTVVGIDLGARKVATLSDNTEVSNPRFLQVELKALAKAQRLEKPKKVIARIHERIANKRRDFQHKLSRSWVNKYDGVIFEDLRVKTMHKWRDLNRSIADVGWSRLITLTANKAEEAGGCVVLVNPAYTSQICSRCGCLVSKTLNETTHKCPHCFLSIDRDLNASLNILALGLQSIGIKPVEAPTFQVEE